MAKYITSHIDLKHLGWFVLGAVHSYCDHTRALGSHEVGKRMALYSETLEKTWSYLTGDAKLDASYSDLQVSIAEEAFKVFKPILPAEGGICEFCGGLNLDHMGGPCVEQRRRGL